MDIKKEIQHIRGLAKVLDTLADEIEQRGNFTDEDCELLKKVGSDVLFKGVASGYTSQKMGEIE